VTPYRLFYYFLKARCDASKLANNIYDTAADWTTTHSEVPYIHFQQGGGGYNYEDSIILFRGQRADGWDALSGADIWMKVFIWTEFMPAEYDTIPCTYYKFVTGALDDPHAVNDEPDYSYLSGRWYKSPEVEWEAFPIHYHWSYAGYTRNIPPSDLPCTERLVIPAWDAIKNSFEAMALSDEGLKNGLVIAQYGYGGGASSGEGYILDINIQYVQAHFMNPMTNSFSRYTMPAAGGPSLILTGLGFNNDEDEIEEGGHINPLGWDDRVDEIYIQTPAGTTVYTFHRIHGDFTIDSNSQITIPSWPTLPAGTYMLQLYKHEGSFDIYGYSGDWRTDSTGRMTAGSRLYIWVTDEIHPPTRPVILTRPPLSA